MNIKSFLKIAILATLSITPLHNAISSTELSDVQIHNELNGLNMEQVYRYFENGDYTKAKSILESLSEKGLPHAYYALAVLKKYGLGVEKDLDESNILFQQAAQKALDYITIMESKTGQEINERKIYSVLLKNEHEKRVYEHIKRRWEVSGFTLDRGEYCSVEIRQDTDGYVQSVALPYCNENTPLAFKKELFRVINESQPLPQPDISEAYFRTLNIYFGQHAKN